MHPLFMHGWHLAIMHPPSSCIKGRCVILSKDIKWILSKANSSREEKTIVIRETRYIVIVLILSIQAISFSPLSLTRSPVLTSQIRNFLFVCSRTPRSTSQHSEIDYPGHLVAGKVYLTLLAGKVYSLAAIAVVPFRSDPLRSLPFRSSVLFESVSSVSLSFR